jgi:DNA-directed RNA polymerase specialized sigma24 family protein
MSDEDFLGLWKEKEKDLLRIARNRLRNDGNAAQDVLQITFVKCWPYRERIAKHAAWKFVKVVLLREIINWWRAQDRRRTQLDPVDPDDVPAAPSPESDPIADPDAILIRVRIRLAEALKEMSPLERTALTACWEAGGIRKRALQKLRLTDAEAGVGYDQPLCKAKQKVRQVFRRDALLGRVIAEDVFWALHLEEELWELVAQELHRDPPKGPHN